MGKTAECEFCGKITNTRKCNACDALVCNSCADYRSSTYISREVLCPSCVPYNKSNGKNNEVFKLRRQYK